VALQPFIVTLACSVDDFRRSLTDAIPQASIARELRGGRVVVVIPAEHRAALAMLPTVVSLAPDELRHPLHPGRSG
jgi:hypothetical protein